VTQQSVKENVLETSVNVLMEEFLQVVRNVKSNVKKMKYVWLLQVVPFNVCVKMIHQENPHAV